MNVKSALPETEIMMWMGRFIRMPKRFGMASSNSDPGERTNLVDAPHVQLIVDQSPVPPSLRTALQRLNARVSVRSLGKAKDTGISPLADVCVILPGQDNPPDVLEAIMANATARACCTMVLPAGPDESGRSSRMTFDGPVSRALLRRTGRDFSADELTGRIQALCEIRGPLRRMNEELNRLRQRDEELTSGVRHFDEQLQLAGQIQQDLLAECPQDTGPLTVSRLFLPADRVSGDIYDVSRLDEHHLSFSIADATGHGMPAALLTIFIKNLLRGRETVNGSHRIIQPDELLGRLNREIVGSNLTQCQFITGLHAIFDCRSAQVRWARGGIPYPILLRPGQPPRHIRSEGGLIGAFEEQAYEIVSHDFRPGDVLLFYTDGLDALLADSLVEPLRELTESSWIRGIAASGPQAGLAELGEYARTRPEDEWHRDDITVLALQMN